MRHKLRLLAVSSSTTVFGVIAGLLATSVSRLTGMETFGYSLYILPSDPSFFGILSNNLVVYATTIAGFGLVTLSNLFLAGIPLGVELVHNDFVWLIIPHGIFEFPALWFAGAAGLRIPSDLARYLQRETDRVLTPSGIRMVVRYALLSLALFVVAGLVETTVTRWLAEWAT